MISEDLIVKLKSERDPTSKQMFQTLTAFKSDEYDLNKLSELDALVNIWISQNCYLNNR